MNTRILRCRAVIVPAVAFTMLLWGCVETRYVYIRDGEFPVHSCSQAIEIAVQGLAFSDAAPHTASGTWRGSGDWEGRPGQTDQPVLLRLVSQSGSTTTSLATTIPPAQVSGLPLAVGHGYGKAMEFSVRRSVGMLLFTGQHDGSRASGEVRFEADEAYLSELAALTSSSGASTQTTQPTAWPSAGQMMTLLVHDLDLQYIRDIRAAGYTLTLGEVLRLRRSGVSASYAVSLAEAGYKLSIDELIDLSRNGVSAGYARSIREAGYELSPADLIRLSRNGISSSYAKGVREAGYGRELDELIDLSRNGISSSYLAGLRQAGYSLSAGDVIKLSRNGISVSNAKGMREAGYTLSPDDLIELSRHGVSASYAKSAHDAGCSFTPAELIRLNQNGVSASYLAALHDPQRPSLPVEDIIDLSHRGINAETVKRLRGK